MLHKVAAYPSDSTNTLQGGGIQQETGSDRRWLPDLRETNAFIRPYSLLRSAKDQWVDDASVLPVHLATML